MRQGWKGIIYSGCCWKDCQGKQLLHSYIERKSTHSAKTQHEQGTKVLKVAASDLGRKPEAHVESQRASAPGESSELDTSSQDLCPDGSELTAPSSIPALQSAFPAKPHPESVLS